MFNLKVFIIKMHMKINKSSTEPSYVVLTVKHIWGVILQNSAT